jgi:UDP-N-acetylglucosamine 2-epimerase (non-hydrolysing)
MSRFEPVCLEEKPAWVVVVGDVNSTMACTLVCSKLGIKVAHVEAGLRSYDRTMPEEINRLVTDALADLLLTPSADADENLKREGIPDSRIKLVGNVMIDALTANLDKARRSPVLDKLGLQRKAFVYVTLHRPSNVDEQKNLSGIMSGLTQLASRLPVVFPMHPRTHKMLGQFGISVAGNGRLKILEPIGYHDSICLTENARLVLTDSGGLQEESTFFKTPCLTLRPNTERPITVTVGSNRLTHLDRLSADLDEVLRGREELGQVPPLWDGHAADRIVEALVERR